RLWLHGQNWIGFIEKMKFHLFSNQVQTILDNQNHYVLLQPDLQNGIYYGNVFDIYHLEQQSGPIERLGRISGLITEGVTSFLIDREKNLWITSFRGVSKIQSLRFRNYRKDHGLLQNEVTAIAEIEPGKLVFGHENGLTFFTRDKFHTLSFFKDKSDSEVRTRVLDLKVDPDKNIWVAASMLGLARINTKGKIDWFRQNAGLEGIITSILIDKQGKLWVADQRGLHQYNGKKFTYPNSQPLSFSSRRSLFPTIRKLFPGPGNSIYIATSGDGIYLYSENQWYHYICTQRIRANNVYFILNDSQSRLWIGTLAGLFILQNNQIVKYQQDNFEIDRPVYLIIEDLKGRLWFGTDNGVIRWDGTNKKSFTVQEGFVGQEINRAAGLTDRLGHVWIGSDLGVSKYQEKFDYTQNELSPPLIEFTYLDVFGKKLPLDKVNNLSYQQNTLIFHFQGISFIDEKSLRYRYQLQGYDLDWHFLKNPATPEIRYTNLSPGKYKFQIQVMNNADCRSTVKSSEWIVIETPFWNTYWFNTIWILTLITILSGSYILRITFLKKKQMAQQIFSRKLLAEIENGRRQIANELHDGLGQNLLVVKNEIQRCLNLQSRSVECIDELKEIDWLLIESINELREISYYLHPHQIERLGLTTAIESCIEKLIKSTTLQIEYQIDKIDNLLPKELEIHIFRIIQEASNNIIKHAKANQVRIQIKYIAQKLQLVVQDDGCGFDSKNYFLTQSRQTGLGLSGIAERVKILTGEFQIFSAPGKGTELKITIPLRGQPNVNNN
ncbi:hypothetical protein JW964_24925, partial [candidate division KSB1 bacterium]|nr:hypothetical protein [candidate division KSB1 bacterium]